MKDQDDVDRDNRKHSLLFFEIEPSSPRISLQEMGEITPEQAAKAVLHTGPHGGEIEIYLTDEWRQQDGDTPAIGFIFSGGMYTGYGLGDDEVMALEETAKESFSEPAEYGTDLIGFSDAPDLEQLMRFFTDCITP